MGKDYVPYWEKLRDPRWQQCRLRVMERDQWMCRTCYAEGVTLNIHHAYYEKGRDPWDYPEESLRTLCEECHERWHAIQNAILALTATGGIERFDEILGVVKARYSGRQQCTVGAVNFVLDSIDQIYGAASEFFSRIPLGMFICAPTPQTTDDIRRKAADTFPDSYYEPK